MAKVLSLLYAMHFFVTAALLYSVSAILLAVTWPFDPNRQLLHYLNSVWGYHFVAMNPFWRCKIEGGEQLDCRTPYIIVANHQSMADIFILSGLHLPFKWVSKESLFKIPFFGWNMMLNEYIPIKRGDRSSIRQMMETCRKWLLRGASIMMFPEGTRSDTGELMDFRIGSFRLATDLNIPILPVVVDGTRDIIIKHKRQFNFVADVRVKVLEPVYPDRFDGQYGKLRSHVHEAMKTSLSEMRQIVDSVAVHAIS
jgi:1-acyl-sn-glycerol-3-phosphate acyltransferase